jgi:O-antigen/teichoic acid export membrane protein
MSRLIKNAVAWNLLGHAIQTANMLVQAAIVSRLFSPAEVGIFAVAKTVQSFVRATPSSGILYSLATLPRLRKIHFQMISGFMPVIGVMQFLVIFFAADIAGWMIGPSPIITILPCLAGLCIIESFQLPGEAAKLRLIDHRQLVLVDLAIVGPSLIGLGISFYMGLGIYSLVVAAYCESITKALFYYIVIWGRTSPIWPRLQFIGPVLAHGLKLTFSTLLLLASTQGDRLLIGLLHGPAAAAGFWRTNQIINLPLALYSRITYRVLTSASSDEARSGLKPEWIAKVGLHLSLRLGAVLGLVLALFSASITDVLLGSMWQSAAGVMALLAPFVCFKFLSRSLDPLMLGGRHAKSSITGQLILAGGIFAGLLLAAPAGVFWACLIVGMAHSASGIFYVGACLKKSLLTLNDIASSIKQTLTDALLFGLPALGIFALSRSLAAPAVIQLAAAILIIVIWGGSVLMSARKTFSAMREAVPSSAV